MNTEKAMEIMGREMRALGQYYRNDWSGFDGRTLRSQLDRLASWGASAVAGNKSDEFVDFSELLSEQQMGDF